MKKKKVNLKSIDSFKLIILAFIFTIALLFLSLEIPRILNSSLEIIFPDINTVSEPDKATDFINFMRPIGYIFLFCVLVLIIVGFLVEKKQITITSSFLIFLPTFGKFALSMLFLAGIGILQVILLPLWYPNFNILNLGFIINIPCYLIDLLCLLMFPYQPYFRLMYRYLIIFIGLFIFIYGIFIWFYEKRREKDVFNESIYKFSRHPQYLGFLIWSYGMQSLVNDPYNYGIPMGGTWIETSLFWLLSALIIIAIALIEEINMKKENPEKYSKYQKKTPFLFPLPKSINSILIFPLKKMFKKDFPESKKEVFFIILLYGGTLILISFIALAVHFNQWINDAMHYLYWNSPFFI